MLLGFALGTIGHYCLSNRAASFVFYCIGVIGLVLAAREWEWVSFPVPERKSQTEKRWVHEFGFATASAMWGVHIGLGFATRVTYGGFWVLVPVAVASRRAYFGAALMLAYWLGRALPVWMAPVLPGCASDATTFTASVLADRLLYHRVVGVALMWSGGVAALIALHTHSITQFDKFLP